MKEFAPKEREAIYDAEIAPELARLGKRCEEVGMKFAAVVEWAPGETGYTFGADLKPSASMWMTYRAVRANGNFDRFMMWARQYAREHGPGNSMELHLMLREEKRHEEENARLGIKGFTT